MYGAPVKRGNGPATAAITCGLIAITIAWIPFLVFVGIALAVAAGDEILRRRAADVAIERQAGRVRGLRYYPRLSTAPGHPRK